jgi:dUTP pyrophosphatase
MNQKKISLTLLPHGKDLSLPKYASEFSSGADLLAAVKERVLIGPRKWEVIPTGIALSLPSGFEGQIRSRSGLAMKYGVTCLNAPGTIDSDYRGEIKVILINHGQNNFEIERGMRIAQLVILPYITAIWEKTGSLDKTVRGTKGFGSSGIISEK